MSNRVSRRQAGRWAEQEQAQASQQPPPQQYQQQPAYAPPPPPPAPGMDDKLAQLTQLGQLRDQGILTEAEFEAQKAAILNS